MPQPVNNLMFVVEVNGHRESSWSDLAHANAHAKRIIRWVNTNRGLIVERKLSSVLIRAVPVE